MKIIVLYFNIILYFSGKANENVSLLSSNQILLIWKKLFVEIGKWIDYNFFHLRKTPCSTTYISYFMYCLQKNNPITKYITYEWIHHYFFFCILASSTSVYLAKKLSHFLRCVMLRYLSLFWHRKTSELHCLTQYSHLLLI